MICCDREDKVSRQSKDEIHISQPVRLNYIQTTYYGDSEQKGIKALEKYKHPQALLKALGDGTSYSKL